MRPISRINSQCLGGFAIVAISLIALFNVRELDTGTLSEIGPALIPRALAVLLLILGLAIAASGYRSGEKGAALAAWSLRPVLAILGGIVLFGLMIRTVGVVFAAPLALGVAGFATTETKWRELAVFVLVLTIFCATLFRIILGLPIPLAPMVIGY